MASVTSIILSIPLIEDIFIMSIFLAGFIIWTRFTSRNTFSGKRVSKTLEAKVAQSGSNSIHCAAKASRDKTEIMQSCKPQMNLVAETSEEEAEIGPQGQPIYNGLRKHHQTELMEAKMIALLENRGFRNALNLFRFVRRSVGIQDYTQQLFYLFIQSAIRLGKMDVVEYMLNAMAEIPTLALPQNFWGATLKHLWSQKGFEAIVLAHEIFGSKIGLDIAVFQLLISAELRMGVPEHKRKVLKRLVHNDGVLQHPSAILNNHILWCLREEQPKLALQAIREVQALDKKDGPERIVNLKSYKRPIKTWGRDGNSAMCVELFNELIVWGLEPDEDTCRMVIDCCVKTGNVDAAREIETRFESTLMPPDKS